MLELLWKIFKYQKKTWYDYLGSRITEDARSETERVRIIAIAKSAFSEMKNVLGNMNIRFAARIRSFPEAFYHS